MPFVLDPHVQAALAPMMAAMGDAAPPPVGDVTTRHRITEAIMAQTGAAQPMPADVAVTDYNAEPADGTRIPLRWYAKDGGALGSAALYLHGGGMIMDSAALYDGPVARYVSHSGVPMLSVDYRRAPEHPHPTPVEDCYAGLHWLSAHAAQVGVDPTRIAVMGASAGGGLAAALALLARDRGGPALTRQILIYPMLDDRNTIPDPAIAPFALWSYDDNSTGWGALLGDAIGGPDVPAYAAPARATDLTGLPAAYIEVGQVDIFRDEDLAYAQRLCRAGVEVEFHLRPGVPHAFETFAYDTGVARRASADRIRILRSL